MKTQEIGLGKGQGHMGHTGVMRLLHKTIQEREARAGGSGTCLYVALGTGDDQLG